MIEELWKPVVRACWDSASTTSCSETARVRPALSTSNFGESFHESQAEQHMRTAVCRHCKLAVATEEMLTFLPP